VLSTILAFNASNQLAVRRDGARTGLAFTATDLPGATARLESVFKTHTTPQPRFITRCDGLDTRVHLAQVTGQPTGGEIIFSSIDALQSTPAALAPALVAALAQLEPHLIEIPGLHLGENDFIYKFRPDKERNSRIYQLDPDARALYQSQLCAAIKTLARTNERTASAPVPLDFGAVRYLIPSHFGFCLGVKNAIERAYETLAENPGRRVFMLSELIHNPYVNEDLLRRGLRYLQTDKGHPLKSNTGFQRGTGVPPLGLSSPGVLPVGLDSNTTLQPAKSPPSPKPPTANPAPPDFLWDTLTPDDIVIIPAFGATDDDKRRLIKKGLPVIQYDATCMLVEKVWKAARAFGREGYSIIIHGKHEHEETKATFSNARRHAPALIVRNLAEARILTGIIADPDSPAAREKFTVAFAGKHTPGFDPCRDLDRIAVVNQTTLLMNETLGIIEHLRAAYAAKYGSAEADARVGGNTKRDTLCYATQVNQDALSRALSEPLDAAIVIGGKNSSNTYQLHRLCEQRLGSRAFFIQSERNIRALDAIEHYHFPAHGPRATNAPFDNTELKPLPLPVTPDAPLRILITGGASCPDGIIQQVITRINSLHPAACLRPIESVLADLKK
jgi:4-hydroxy-3-methylbut-2-enyl diphosphate reductase